MRLRWPVFLGLLGVMLVLAAVLQGGYGAGVRAAELALFAMIPASAGVVLAVLRLVTRMRSG